ncbi:MAG: type II toxin-antitoxin system HicB family antitoxin [Gemmatimonadota bacterium]
MHYSARVSREGRRTLVAFPDCPGCQTFAESGEDVADVAREALESWLEAELKYGEAPPAPGPRSRAAKRIDVRIDSALAVRLQLRWARLKLGLSQSELAKRVGVTRQQISLLESPDANLTLGTLEKVAAALNMDLEIELLSRSAAWIRRVATVPPTSAASVSLSTVVWIAGLAATASGL